MPLGAADGNWAVTSIVEALSRLLATNQTTADDVAFIQFGADLMGSANTEGKHLRYVRQFTRSVSRLPPLRLVWLEQFAQHFATPDGVYAPGGCRPLADTVTKPPILAKVAAEVSQHASILLVDAWTLTRNASGHHLAREHGRVDCTHYCLFSGVYDSVLAAAACALSELRVNVSELSSSQTQRRSVYAQSYENDAGARRAAAAERTVPRARSRQGSDRRPADQHDLHAPANAASRHLCAASFPAAWSALHELRPRTVAYVCDPNVACGGLGDRMAGIITVVAYALATNRTALVMDEALLAAFSARHQVSATPAVLRSCYGHTNGCSWLQHEQPEAHLGVVGNGRCEVCRWLRASRGWGPLLRDFGLHWNVPLAASCLLHSVLSPRADVVRLSQAWLAGVPLRVGVHVRTFSLRSKGERGYLIPPDATAAVRCAAMAAVRGGGREGGALTLSDSPAAARKLSDTLSSSFVNVSSSRSAPCHVNGDHRTKLSTCMVTTAVDWLGLSSARLLISSCDRGRSSGFVMYAAIWGYAEQTASAASEPPRLLRTSSPDGNGSCWSVEHAWNVTTDGSWLCR